MDEEQGASRGGANNKTRARKKRSKMKGPESQLFKLEPASSRANESLGPPSIMSTRGRRENEISIPHSIPRKQISPRPSNHSTSFGCFVLMLVFYLSACSLFCLSKRVNVIGFATPAGSGPESKFGSELATESQPEHVMNNDEPPEAEPGAGGGAQPGSPRASDSGEQQRQIIYQPGEDGAAAEQCHHDEAAKLQTRRVGGRKAQDSERGSGTTTTTTTTNNNNSDNKQRRMKAQGSQSNPLQLNDVIASNNRTQYTRNLQQPRQDAFNPKRTHNGEGARFASREDNSLAAQGLQPTITEQVDRRAWESGSRLLLEHEKDSSLPKQWLDRSRRMTANSDVANEPHEEPASGSSSSAPIVRVVAGFHNKLVLPCGGSQSSAEDSNQAGGLLFGASDNNNANHNHNSNANHMHNSNTNNNNRAPAFGQMRRGFGLASNTKSSSSSSASMRNQHQHGISLLVWHKDDQLNTPIFVADARNSPGNLKEARQVTSSEQLKSRANLEELINNNNNNSQQQRNNNQHNAIVQPALVIREPNLRDSGLYTCTIEFLSEPTQTHQVRAQVISPPTNMIIREESQENLEFVQLVAPSSRSQGPQQWPLVLGPFDEGALVTVSCGADSGVPEPGHVSWWRPLDSMPALHSNPKSPSWPQQSHEPDANHIDIHWPYGDFMTTISSAGLDAAADHLHSQAHTLVAFHTHQSLMIKSAGRPMTTNAHFNNNLATNFKWWARIGQGTESMLASANPTSNNWTIEGSSKQPQQQPTLQQIRSTLQLNLKREHLNQEFLCLAQNNRLSPPLNQSLHFNLNLKPTDVKIINKGSYNFQLGQRIAIECHIFGSKPAPKVKWLLGDQELDLVNASSTSYNGNEGRGNQILSNNSNFSETSRDMSSQEAAANGARVVLFAWASHLSFVAQLRDHQQTLTCSAQNPKMVNEPPLSDTLVMDVQYLPQLSLQFGASIRPESIRLGADVFMDCNVRSNPPISSKDLTWLHDDQPLSSNASAGIIMSNQTLVIQKIRLEHRGHYQCVAQNPIGRALSNSLELKPKFAPICDYTRTKTRHEVSLQTPTRIDCFVLAEPSEDVHFEWKFNKSLSSYPPPPLVSSINQQPNVSPNAGSAPDTSSSSSSSSSDLMNNEYADFKIENINSTTNGEGGPGSGLASSNTHSNNIRYLETVKQYETNFTQSHILFRPESSKYSGQLECRASNSIGSQLVPCIMQIIPFELPEPVIGCFSDTITPSSFSIHCQPSAPLGGQPFSQLGKLNYLLELYVPTTTITGEEGGADDNNSPPSKRGGKYHHSKHQDTHVIQRDQETGDEDENDSSNNSSDDSYLENVNNAAKQQKGQEQRAHKLVISDQIGSSSGSKKQAVNEFNGSQVSMRKLKQIVSDQPSFHLEGLEPDTGYNVLVYAQSSKARSVAASLPTSTLPGPGPGSSSAAITDSSAGGGRVELFNNKRLLNSKDGSSWFSFSDKLYSQIKLTDLMGNLNGNSRRFIEISLIVILCAISLALVTFLLTHLCRPSRGAVAANSPKQRRRPKDTRAANKSKLRVQVASSETNNEPSSPIADSLANQTLETYDKRKAQLDSGIQLTPANSLQLPGAKLVANSRGEIVAGAGSDSSRETNTESTLISSTTRTNNTTNSTSNSRTTINAGAKSNARRVCIQPRARAGSDLSSATLNMQMKNSHNNKMAMISKTPHLMSNYGASLMRYSHANDCVRDVNHPIGHHHYNQLDHHPVANLYGINSAAAPVEPTITSDHGCPDQGQVAIPSLGMSIQVQANSCENPDTPQCTLRSNSDCASNSHDLTIRSSANLPNEQPVYIIDHDHTTARDSSYLSHPDQVQAAYLSLTNESIPTSTSYSRACRLYASGQSSSLIFAGDNDVTMNRPNHLIGAHAFGQLPNSTSTPVSLSNYAVTPGPMPIHRSSSRQEISSLIQQVIRGSSSSTDHHDNDKFHCLQVDGMDQHHHVDHLNNQATYPIANLDDYDDQGHPFDGHSFRRDQSNQLPSTTYQILF